MRKMKMRSLSSPAVIDALENRMLLSGTVTPATGVATVTTLTTPSAAVLGQALTVSVVVQTTQGAAVAGGTVDLFNGGTNTGMTATTNAAGLATFTFDAGNALYAGSYALGAQFTGTAGDLASQTAGTSALTVSEPTFTTEGDGLQVATVTAGSGTSAVSGQTMTVKYTGFYQTTGTEFDDSSAHSPNTFTYTLNADPEQVITGFDEGTTGIKIGETRVVVIPSALGYNDGQVRVFIIQSVGAASPGPATHLVIGQQPTDATAGAIIAPTITVDVEDANGHLVDNYNSNVTLGIASGPSGATLGGYLTVKAVSGVATFSNLVLDEAGVYTLQATYRTQLSSAPSSSFTISPAAPAKLAFRHQPTATAIGSVINPGPAVTVVVEDVFGNVCKTYPSNVTIGIASGPGGAVLGGYLTVKATNGVGVFSNLTLNEGGVYTLVASHKTLTTATSFSFDINGVSPGLATFSSTPILAEDEGNLATTPAQNSQEMFASLDPLTSSSTKNQSAADAIS